MASVMKSLTRPMIPEERDKLFANQIASRASHAAADGFARTGVAVGLLADSSSVVVSPDSDFGPTKTLSERVNKNESGDGISLSACQLGKTEGSLRVSLLSEARLSRGGCSDGLVDTQAGPSAINQLEGVVQPWRVQA